MDDSFRTSVKSYIDRNITTSHSFRHILMERESKGETNLYSVLKNMTDYALKSWLSQMGEDKRGSYTGFPHTSGVEHNLDHSVPYSIKQQFSTTEIFVLLASVLLHDLGKIFDPDNHALTSCVYVQKYWPQLGIPSHVARWIAILTCSHGWKEPEPTKSCDQWKQNKCLILCRPNTNGNNGFSELDTEPYACDGLVRLKWLAALLRLSDEIDNQESRTSPDWMNESKERHWRSLITDIIFDPAGECIILRTLSLDKSIGWNEQKLKYFSKALGNIKKVIKSRWQKPLQEMGIKYSNVFCEVMLPARSLFTAENLLLFSKNSEFTINIEPSLEVTKHVFKQVYEAIIRLDNALIRKTNDQFFPWDSLAAEAGVDDVDLVRLAANRIEAWPKCMSNGYTFEKNKYINITPVPGLICSEKGWRIDRDNLDNESNITISNMNASLKNEAAEFKKITKSLYISTGIKELDHLLHPEGEMNKDVNSRLGGFYYPQQKDKFASPIITIHGTTGIGKSTLCLQIAVNLMCNTQNIKDNWTGVYYSMEQSPTSIFLHLHGYKYFQENGRYKNIENRILNLETISDGLHSISEKNNSLTQKLLLPRLTKNPPGLSGEELFRRKYNELEQAVNWFDTIKCRPFFIIDSLTALIEQPLSRNQINRLFSLFRSKRIPLLVTLETHRNWATQEEQILFDVARFTADIVVSLSSIEDNGYYKQTVEIQKTRYNRRILGKHLLKLKSPNQTATSGFDDRVGVVVYPSVDHHLVKCRMLQSSSDGKKKGHGKITISINHDTLPLGRVRKDKSQSIDRNACIVISGPMGGHKFAIGMNILLAANIKKRSDEKPNDVDTMILSFAEEQEIRLAKVALLSQLEPRRKQLIERKKKKHINSNPLPGAKVFERKLNKIAEVNFRLGKIMPEEFLYIIEEYLDKNKTINKILFADSSQLRTRFPLLNEDQLFLPSLIDIIKNRNIFSIFIDVTNEQNEPTQSILAAADCRILSGYDGDNNIIRLDNVRYKDYDRNPRSVDVKKDDTHDLYHLLIKKRK